MARPTLRSAVSRSRRLMASTYSCAVSAAMPVRSAISCNHRTSCSDSGRDVRRSKSPSVPTVAPRARIGTTSTPRNLTGEDSGGGFLGVLVVPMRARGATVGTLGLFERRTSRPLSEHDVRWLQEIADRTGMAADNAQLYVDAISRLERLTALRSVGLAITGSPDLRLTLRVILDQVTAGLSIDAADVLMLDEADGTLAMVASTGFQSTSIPDYRLPVDEGLPGSAILGRRIETVTALGAFTQFRRRSLFAREGFKSYGAVPLIARGKL